MTYPEGRIIPEIKVVRREITCVSICSERPHRKWRSEKPTVIKRKATQYRLNVRIMMKIFKNENGRLLRPCWSVTLTNRSTERSSTVNKTKQEHNTASVRHAASDAIFVYILVPKSPSLAPPSWWHHAGCERRWAVIGRGPTCSLSHLSAESRLKNSWVCNLTQWPSKQTQIWSEAVPPDQMLDWCAGTGFLKLLDHRHAVQTDPTRPIKTRKMGLVPDWLGHQRGHPEPDSAPAHDDWSTSLTVVKKNSGLRFLLAVFL